MKHKITGKQNNSSGCLVCGDHNELSLNTRFYELDNGEVAAVFRTEEWHQSYPGRVHGGMSAAVLDETIGRALCVTEPEIWGVTIELELKYRKPVPTGAVLTAVGRITRNTRKIFEGTGEILLPDGTVAVEAKGKYFKMQIKELVNGKFLDDEWYQIEEDIPEEIDL
ncbi:MAG: PaaI family thioesterase [Clostridiales Family XIII bacterium]|jgi:uncharacterized protein (TIGR00369 family)|nr:PaaI family thioesterase [Clostridiales Family XIII bacterium]